MQINFYVRQLDEQTVILACPEMRYEAPIAYGSLGNVVQALYDEYNGILGDDGYVHAGYQSDEEREHYEGFPYGYPSDGVDELAAYHAGMLFNAVDSPDQLPLPF